MQSFDKTKPVMVTGATGYVAGRLIEKLLSEGLTVHATVRNPENKESIKYLEELAHQLPGSINYFKADLLTEGSFAEAMKGCQVVFHTASPFVRKVNDSQKDLVDPAKKGTRNVLETVNQTSSVERVVVTSSCAAIYGDTIDLLNLPNQTITEENWNTTSSLTNQPYSFSKTEAEKEAWKIAQAQNRWELVVINPSLVLGPGINPHAHSESYAIVKQIGNGDLKMGGPDFHIGAVDVRDLAVAHYKAGTTPEAKGRYIISAAATSILELAGYVKEKYPNYPIKLRKLPKWLIWLIAPSIGMTRKEVSKNIGYPWNADNSKGIRELGITYRPIKETIVDFFTQLVEAGEIGRK